MPSKIVVPWKIIDRFLLPSIFFLTSLVAVLTFWQLLLGHRREEIHAVTNEQASFVKSKVEAELRERIMPLQGLAAQWSTLDSDREKKSAAALMMSGYPDYQAVEWVDPTFHVRWAASSDANEGDRRASPSADAVQQVAFQTAGQYTDVMITRPVNLAQGGRGLQASVPGDTAGKLSGFLVGGCRCRELISSMLRDVAQGYWVALYDGSAQIYGEGANLAPETRFGPAPSTYNFEI